MSSTALPPVISALIPAEETAVEFARNLARDVLGPGAADAEARQELPLSVMSQLGAEGLTGMTLPKTVGGAGLSHVASLAVFEALAYGDMAVAFALLCQNSTARSIWLRGTTAQHEHWLPGLLSAEDIGAYVITEPTAGSDPGSMETVATRSSGDWTLDGIKTLISNVPLASTFVLSAKTNADAGTRGMSAFIVSADAAGIDGVPLRLHGSRALPVGQLTLRDVQVPGDAVLGAEGEGFKIALDAVNWARAVWAALAAGVAQASLDGAIAYVREREQFGQKIADFQAVQFQLAELATDVETARLHGYRAAAFFDSDDPAQIGAAAMAKLTAGEVAVRVTSKALELLGGVGYVVPSPLERYLRQARMAQLADGTSNIQRLVIARSLE
jgi:alkylation response protein AidB-like acyl-CoA dehydrogenase